MNPTARRNGFTLRETWGLLLAKDEATQKEFQLDTLTGFIWRNSDGLQSVVQIAAAASRYFQRSVRTEEIWGSLDWLSDAGLMQARVTPPAAGTRVSRREAIGVGLCVQAVVAGVFATRTAFAQSGEIQSKISEEQVSKKMEEQAEKQAAEQRVKRQQQAEQNTKQQAEQNAKQQQRAEQKNKAHAEMPMKSVQF